MQKKEIRLNWGMADMSLEENKIMDLINSSVLID